MLLQPSTWAHLRIPFSLFLAPVFVIAWAFSPEKHFFTTLWAFIAIHLFLYPASNGYNSFFDKDEGSIGGLEKPPKVTRQLLYASNLFDVVGWVIGGFGVSVPFAMMMIVYSLISRAYSYDKIRLKKYPILSWLIVGSVQGGFTFAMTYLAVNQLTFSELLDKTDWYAPALAVSCMLWASYPMTQVYQHQKDKKRGDKPLSMLLGIRGTFIFTLLMFGLTTIFLVYLIYNYRGIYAATGFIVFLSPTLIWFQMWLFKVWKDEKQANFQGVMKLNKLSSSCMIAYFLILGLM